MPLRKFIAIKTETTTITEVYEVSVDQGGRSYPTADDLAINATANTKPVATETRRSLDFKVMERT